MHTLDRRRDCSPCFRTNADGDILLRPEWSALLADLRDRADWFITTRHAYARLVSQARLPAWVNAHAVPASFRDPEGELHLHAAQLDEAVARLEDCPCCGSPGIIEFRGTAGRPALELRALPGHNPLDLAEVPAAFAAIGSLARIAPASASALFPTISCREFPHLPAAALPDLLGHCSALALPLLWRLLTPETDHRRIFVPEHVALAEGLLTAADRHRHSCQLVLPAAAWLACERTAHAALLHVVAADDTLLLTLTAGSAPHISPAWEGALAALSPAFRQP